MNYLPAAVHLTSPKERMDMWRPTSFVGLNVFALSSG